MVRTDAKLKALVGDVDTLSVFELTQVMNAHFSA